MQTPVIFVLSKPHHGKTEARKYLSEVTSLKGGSCSDCIDHFLAARKNISVETWRQTPKEERRPQQIEAGDFIVGTINSIKEPAQNTELDDAMYRVPSALIRQFYLTGHNVIDGVRRKTELSDARKHLDWNGVRSLVIWIERPGYPSPADNTQVEASDCDDVVVNDGTIEDLKVKLFACLVKHYGPQDEIRKPIPVVDITPATD